MDFEKAIEYRDIESFKLLLQFNNLTAYQIIMSYKNFTFSNPEIKQLLYNKIIYDGKLINITNNKLRLFVYWAFPSADAFTIKEILANLDEEKRNKFITLLIKQFRERFDSFNQSVESGDIFNFNGRDYYDPSAFNNAIDIIKSFNRNLSELNKYLEINDKFNFYTF